MQKNKYKRLANKERESISRGLSQKKSIREIAREIGRSLSIVTREIKRNSGKTGYRAFSASKNNSSIEEKREEQISQTGTI